MKFVMQIHFLVMKFVMTNLAKWAIQMVQDPLAPDRRHQGAGTPYDLETLSASTQP